MKRISADGLDVNEGWYVEIVEPSLERVASGIVYLEKSMPGSADDSSEGSVLDVGVLLGLLCTGTRLEYGGGSEVNVWSKMISLSSTLLSVLSLVSIACRLGPDWDTAFFDILHTELDLQCFELLD